MALDFTFQHRAKGDASDTRCRYGPVPQRLRLGQRGIKASSKPFNLFQSRLPFRTGCQRQQALDCPIKGLPMGTLQRVCLRLLRQVLAGRSQGTVFACSFKARNSLKLTQIWREYT